MHRGDSPVVSTSSSFPSNRIAFVLSSLGFGGAERVTINLALELKRQGYFIDILLMQHSGEFLELAHREFNVVDLRCTKTWRLPLKLIRYARTVSPTAMISSFWKLNICLAAVRPFAPRVAIGLWEHSSPQAEGNSPTWLFAPTASVLYALSTCIVTVSQSVADDIAQRSIGLRRRIVTIGNAIPPPQFSRLRNRSAKRSIVWVGRFADVKNPNLMIEAFLLLPSEERYSLLFIGDGPLRLELEEKVATLGVSDRVTFSGFLPDPLPLIAQSDLLVLSSRAEGLPTVLIEAMYLGVNMVSTDCGSGVHEILQDGRLGTIVPNGDAALLARGIVNRLDDPINGDLLEAAAHRYNPTAVAAQFRNALGIL